LITACYSVYNCASTLSESIDSVLPYVDGLVFVDGVCLELWWQTHCAHDPPPKDGKSTDGTLDVITKFEKKHRKKILHFTQDRPWMHEVQKRNKTLELAKDSDYYLTVDGDCVYTGDVEGGLKDIVDSGKCGEFQIYNYHNGLLVDKPTWTIWLWRHVLGIHFCRVHTMIFDENHVPLPQPYGVFRTTKFHVKNMHVS
jgi:glycosyltransferase involved in cell wall biosynthesis